MSPDYSSNHTGPADFNVDGSFVTHFIFGTFLLLFTIPIRLQAVNIYSRLQFHQKIHMLHIYFIHIFHTFTGLYHLVWECQNLQEPALETNQAFRQILPLSDEYLFIQMYTPIVEHQPVKSPSTTAQNQQDSVVSPQDRTPTEFKCQQKMCETFVHQKLTFLLPSQIYTSSIENLEESLPPEVTRDQQPMNDTPIHPVEPVFGTTPIEEHWIHNWEQGQDIADIWRVCKGYVKTTIQTLNGLYVNQPNHFLPLTEEANHYTWPGNTFHQILLTS